MAASTAQLQLPERAMSYWVDSTDQPSFPRLSDTVETDVAVVGAGIAGISTATFLAEAGHDVVLVEANQVARGTTGHITAKVTVAHGLRYDYLIETFGEEGARLYADANRTALEAMAARVDERGIDCDFTRADAYTYAPTRKQRASVEREVDAARRLGLEATYESDLPAPVHAEAAIRYPDQAHFHPRAYLRSLVESFEAAGGRVYENTRVRGIETGRPHRLAAGDGRVVADDVVAATHHPFHRRLLYAMRTLPGQEYIVTVDVDGEPPGDLYYSAGPQSHSFRPVPTDDGTMLLVEGRKHPTGLGGDTMERTRQVESFAADHFPVSAVTYRWSAQDYMTLDRVPYTGRISPLEGSVYVATGFGAWGMTHGTVAGMLLSDLIDVGENDWERLYDPNRVPPLRSMKRLPKAGTNMLRQLLAGYRDPKETTRVADLAPGEGRVVRVDGETVGLYRTREGEWQAVTGTCPYDGCTLQWNGAGESWDCPCDGSRFTVDGTAFDGAARSNLRRRPVTVNR